MIQLACYGQDLYYVGGSFTHAEAEKLYNFLDTKYNYRYNSEWQPIYIKEIDGVACYAGHFSVEVHSLMEATVLKSELENVLNNTTI